MRVSTRSAASARLSSKANGDDAMPGASPDIVIIGSGIGGATIAAGLAPSGATITILEAGHRLPDRPENRDQRAIFQRGFFRPKESWYDAAGDAFNPGNYYNVGGNSKFYGAVLARYRREDFEVLEHLDGISPAWPFGYEELEPWYSKAEDLYQVRGALGDDPTEPPHSQAVLAQARPRRAANRRRPCQAEGTGAPSRIAAARRRYRSLAQQGQDTMGRASQQRRWQDPMPSPRHWQLHYAIPMSHSSRARK